MPKVKVHSLYSERDIRTLDLMAEKLHQWRDATETEYATRALDSRIQSSSTHIGGGCRMGDDPANSYTDQYGKIHGTSNAYVTDASLFVSQGVGDSPSLTI